MPVNWEVEGDSTRHPSTVQAMRWLRDGSHLGGAQQQVFYACAELARQMVAVLPDDPELTAGLRKLTEAKDCFVRASIAQEG